MQIKSLSLAALGLLLFSSDKFVSAEPANEIASIRGAVDASYLSVFGSDDEDVEFELSEEPASHLSKRDACAKYHTVYGSDNCISLAKTYGVSLDNIYDWNPQIRPGCPNLNNGKKYCVAVNSDNSSDCSQTHKATDSDNCINLAKAYGLSLDKFYELNPSIDGGCSNLNTGHHYCVKEGKSASKEVGASSVSSKVAVKSSKKKTTSAKKEVRKKLQTGSDFTYYWLAQQSDYSGGKTVPVKTCSGSTIAQVSENYADALVMEGTGVVGSKILNLGDCSCNGYKCFELVNKNTDPYGLTSYGSPLRPYVTVASNDIPKNTKIFVPALVGWTLPGTSKKHNGCLLVDDQSWSFTDKHIDFYAFSMDNYEALDKSHGITSVDIYEGGSCTLIDYDL